MRLPSDPTTLLYAAVPVYVRVAEVMSFARVLLAVYASFITATACNYQVASTQLLCVFGSMSKKDEQGATP